MLREVEVRIRQKDVKLPFGIALDGWEVLLGGGLACVVVGAVAQSVRFLIWVGLGLMILWVITVFLVNLGIIKPISRLTSGEGGGSVTPGS